MGCPIDAVCNKGAGSTLLMKPMQMKEIIEAWRLEHTVSKEKIARNGDVSFVVDCSSQA